MGVKGSCYYREVPDIDFVAFLKRRLDDEFLSSLERAEYKRMLIKEQKELENGKKRD